MMKRKEAAATVDRNADIVERIKQIKGEHPFWGYRRTWAHLRFVDKLEVNQKRVLRLMQKHGLSVKPNHKLKANRTPTRSKPKPDRPHQWWGIDMSKVMVDGFGCISWLSWTGTPRGSPAITREWNAGPGTGWKHWTWPLTGNSLMVCVKRACI